MPRLWSVLWLLLSGCAVRSMMGNATTLPKHGLEVGAQVGFTRDPVVFTGDENRGTFEALGRFGLTDSIDVGLRAQTEGGSAEGRLQLYRSEGLQALLSLILGAAGGGPSAFCDGSRCTPGVLFFGTLKAVIGFRLSDVFEVVLAPGFTLEQYTRRFVLPNGIPLGDPLASIDASVALHFHLPRGFRIAPEATVLMTVWPATLPRIVRPYFGLGVYKTF